MIRKVLQHFRSVRNQLRNKRSIADFKKLYSSFLAAPGRFTTNDAQDLLRKAFVASKGDTLDWAWRLQKERSAASVQAFRSELFPLMDLNFVHQTAETLRKDGYCVLPWRMSAAWVDAVTNKAKTFNVTGSAGEDVQKAESIKPTQAAYWHDSKDLATISELKDFVNDPGLTAIATAYLECEPVIDLLAAWWTFPTGGGADSKAAQLYHFDLDRIRWLKIFVYLTDVDATTAPHAYVRGSHRSIGKKISHDGRYTDEEVYGMYGKNEEVVFTEPRGTIIIEDTLGFHKGIPAISNHRFIFEFEISINHFGYPYEDPCIKF